MCYMIARTPCLSYAEHRTYSEIELHSRMLRTIPRYVPNLTRLGLYEFIYMSPDDIEDIATALRALESLTLTGVRHALYILHISMLTRLYRVVSCRVVSYGMVPLIPALALTLAPPQGLRELDIRGEDVLLGQLPARFVQHMHSLGSLSISIGPDTDIFTEHFLTGEHSAFALTAKGYDTIMIETCHP